MRGVVRLALAIIALAVVGGVAWWVGRSGPGGADAPAGLTTARLSAVSNASGLALLERDGQLLVATVDEVDEWHGGPERPPLITYSNLDGDAVGGEGSVAIYGEVEALAVRDGVLAFPYKTDAQRVVLKWGQREMVVIDRPEIARLDAAAAEVARGPFFHEFEGLEWFEGGWQLLDAVVSPTARDTPASTRCVFRLWLDESGRLQRISPALRRAGGGLATDYAAALAVLPGDVALVPGFRIPGVRTYAPDGRVLADLPLAVQRVEGVAFHAPTERLFMVRECVGEGMTCAEGVHFGVPLWTAKVSLRTLVGL